MSRTIVSEPRWQSKEKLYRVTLYSGHVHFNDIASNTSEIALLKKVGEDFSKTQIYNWIEENEVRLMYMQNDSHLSWYKTVTFFADITEKQYVDYKLRFI